MVNHSASFSASQKTQIPPVKVKCAGKKKEDEVVQVPISPPMTMEVCDDENFPKLSASTSPSNSAGVLIEPKTPGSVHYSPLVHNDTITDKSLATPVQQCTTAASVPTPTRNNHSPASRPFRYYFNMQVTPKRLAIVNPSAQQRVEAYHDNLVNLLETLYSIDNMVALWPFMEPKATESDLLTNPKNLGALITQLTKYFQGLCIRNEFEPFHVSILLGFSMAYEKFMEYVHLMFVDHKAYLYKRALQAEQVTCVGWLLGSHEDMCIPTFEKLLQEAILRVSTSPSPTPRLALTYKSVWDGSKKLDREKEKAKKSFFKSGCQGLYALHIDVEMAMALGMKSLIKKALKSPVVKAYTNLPLLLVPVLTYKTPQSDQDNIDHTRIACCFVFGGRIGHDFNLFDGTCGQGLEVVFQLSARQVSWFVVDKHGHSGASFEGDHPILVYCDAGCAFQRLQGVAARIGQQGIYVDNGAVDFALYIRCFGRNGNFL